MRLSRLFVYSGGQVQPAVRNKGLELWKGAGAKSPSSVEVMGWLRSSRSPEDKMVKNTSLGGYLSLR